jgi:ribosomal protein S18 acetylase RimI-like enzyme
MDTSNLATADKRMYPIVSFETTGEKKSVLDAIYTDLGWLATDCLSTRSDMRSLRAYHVNLDDNERALTDKTMQLTCGHGVDNALLCVYDCEKHDLQSVPNARPSEAIGFVSYFRGDDLLHLSRIYVQPAYRRKRVASTLLDAMREEMQRLKLTRLRADVTAEESALRLFIGASFIFCPEPTILALKWSAPLAREMILHVLRGKWRQATDSPRYARMKNADGTLTVYYVPFPASSSNAV